MQLHPTSRPRRVRRLIAVSAAAVAVMIAPTACDYGGAAQLDLPTHPGHTDGMNMDDPAQEHEVVPVAQTATSTPSAAADAEPRRPPRRATERRREASGAVTATGAGARGDRPTTTADDPDPDGRGDGLRFGHGHRAVARDGLGRRHRQRRCRRADHRSRGGAGSTVRRPRPGLHGQ